MEQKLNTEQIAAVTSTEGFVRVIAGAGSGKTRALTHRFAFLVNEMGILPENILCVTFTNKAANEMRRRIHNLIGDNDTGYINTFHGFCVAVLQEDSYAVQYPKNFLVLDNSDIDSMLRIIYEERGLTLRDMTFADARDMIEIQKLFKKPEYYLDMIGMSLEALHEKYLNAADKNDIIFYGYLYQEKKCFGLDYNDLIKFTLYIFAQNDDIRLKWQKRLAYIMIDEFQDIDALQYELMEVLCAHHKNLFIVGDPDQTIYTWRGANVKYLLEFDRHFPNTKTVMMLKNYRSTPQILAAANSLIAQNKHRIEKELIPVLPDGKKPVFRFAGNSEEEAKWIVSKIKELHDSGVDYRDITILYRAHYVTRPIEEALLTEKMPYHIYSGVPFFGRAEIKDALSYLRMIVSQDDLSFRRVINTPKRNMGRRRMAYLEEYAEKNGCTLYTALKQTVDDDIFRGTKARAFISLIEDFSNGYEDRAVSDLLAAILNESGYENMLRTEGSQERLDNLAELKQSVLEYETSCGEEATVFHYLAHVALFTNNDVEDNSDKVKLMTVHAAKGLEFPYVMLCGMNEGVFPSRKIKDLLGMEEERRLAFVAMTRAEKGLYLSGAEGYNFDGSPRYPSRFILDIGDELLEYDNKPADSLIADAKEYIALREKYMPENLESELLPIGAKIRHEYLGEGSILDIDTDKGAYLVQFDSLPTKRAISFRVKLTQL
ncbi:MAG TPA: UvrD-helicase domain-containing protein [Candidatus Eubacterium faecipullorum]|uniref:DNA 3'-5' helicase n=1 Tax=Candidatus Eubacterium faecipullorum TaxID=2838571 RepID=A0A9D1RE60_9FIRM|nr:UvrD-helicase domain-containing protein [Candidatus Eubacterium faecipullorum]